MIKILTIGSELKSAQKLGFDTSKHFAGYVKNYDAVIRWGNSTLFYNNEKETRLGEFKNVINPSAAIALNCQKNQALAKLSTVVPTPDLYKENVPDGVEVVYRPWDHSHGRGFSTKKGPLAIDWGYYATQFIKTENEFRVWFVGNQTFCAKRVALNDNDTKAYPCRSNWGYSYCDYVPTILHEHTLNAAKVIGLECGAADVLFYKRKYYFLELNSAPTIDTNKLKTFFQNGINQLVKEKFPTLVAQ